MCSPQPTEKSGVPPHRAREPACSVLACLGVISRRPPPSSANAWGGRTSFEWYADTSWAGVTSAGAAQQGAGSHVSGVQSHDPCAQWHVPLPPVLTYPSAQWSSQDDPAPAPGAPSHALST